MKAIIKGKEIKCPICGGNDFDTREIGIQAVEYDNYSADGESLYVINKDELECTECGWTGYFTNKLDIDTDWKENKIIYER